jgi:hypothetical protein
VSGVPSSELDATSEAGLTGPSKPSAKIGSVWAHDGQGEHATTAATASEHARVVFMKTSSG